MKSRDALAFDRTVPVLIIKVARYPLHHGGLGAIRSLGRVGVPVYAVTEDRLTPAAVSRYLRGRFVAPTTGFEDDSRLLEIFSGIGRRLGRRAIALPTDDEAAVFIAEHAGELAQWFISPAVPRDLPRRLSSKRGLHDTCRRLGIPTPRAVFPASRTDVLEFAACAPFPVVAKNVDPWSRHRVPVVASSTIITTSEELVKAASSWPDPPSVMLQEYIPSASAEDWIFHAYCGGKPDGSVSFTGVKYRSWPPAAGVTSYARIVGNERLADLSTELCRMLGFRGIVDLDWRFDRRDRQYKLLDFNPRLGAQFRLFETDAGIDVVRAMHLDLTGRTVPSGTAIAGRGFVVETLDVPARIAYYRRGASTARVPHARGKTELAWFARDDPFPALVAATRSATEFAGTLRPHRSARTHRDPP